MPLWLFFLLLVWSPLVTIAQPLIPPTTDNTQVPFITNITPSSVATNQNDIITEDFVTGINGRHIAQASNGDLYVVTQASAGGNIKRISALDGTVSDFAQVTNAMSTVEGQDGLIYVGRTDGVITRIAADGTQTTFNSGLTRVHDIIQVANGRFYALGSSSSIDTISADGSRSGRFSKGNLSFATNLAAAADGSFYVVESLDGSIQQVAADGTLRPTPLVTVSTQTQGVAVGRDSYLYVLGRNLTISAPNSSIYQVDPADGSIISTFGEIHMVLDMLQTSDGDFYVIEDASASIKKVSKVYELTIDEFLSNGTAVATVETVDPNADPLNYRISAGNTLGAFTINSRGEILVQDESQLDHQRNPRFDLTVVANDGTNDSQLEALTIHLRDVNLNAPVITQNQSFTVVENAGIGTSLGAAVATDADNGAVLGNWRIVSGNTGNTFAIDPSTGEITVNDNTQLDGATLQFTLGLTVSDGTFTSVEETVTINLLLVNQPPFFTRGNDIDLLEDSAPQTITGWATNLSAGRPEESHQALQFTVTNDQPAFFAAQPTISSDGTLTFALANDIFGVTTVTVVLTDDGGTASGGNDTSTPQTFTIRIEPVNDAPSFTMPSSLSVAYGAASYEEAAWATNIQAGPVNENDQIISFTVVYNNATLFSEPPTLDASGTLRFGIADQTTGTALVTVTLEDNGGTANGGSAQSIPAQFTIEVDRIPQVITFSPIADQKVRVEPLQLQASGGGSGNPIIFELMTEPSTGVAQLEGTMLTLVGEGRVTLIANQAGNDIYAPAEEVSVTFLVEPSDLFLPTLFSPNNDGNNDRFLLRGASSIAQIELTIYDRQGYPIYQSSDFTAITQRGWDGNYEGVKQPPGNYVWVLKGQHTSGRPLQVMGSNTGTVRLIR